MSLFDNEEVLTPEILKQHGFIKCGPNRWGYIGKFYNHSSLFLRIDLSQHIALITIEGFSARIKETIECKTIFDFNYIFNKYSKYSRINGKE